VCRERERVLATAVNAYTALCTAAKSGGADGSEAAPAAPAAAAAATAAAALVRGTRWPVAASSKTTTGKPRAAAACGWVATSATSGRCAPVCIRAYRGPAEERIIERARKNNQTTAINSEVNSF
jgi:hypothetical protein